MTEAEEKSQSAFDDKVTVDGKMDDWQGVARTTSPNGLVEYACANSKDNLFILFKIADPAEQMKLIRGGMQVWIDPTGKHQKTTEIIYPVKGEIGEENLRPAIVQGEKPGMNEMHRYVESQLISLNRIGFKPEDSGVQSIRENTGFKGAINWDDNNDLIYEVVIPFAAFNSNVKKDNIEVGFFIGAADKPKNPSGDMPTPGEGGGRGMSGGMRGGGRRGGSSYGNRQGQGNNQQSTIATTDWKKMYEAESFWVRYSVK